MASKKGDKTKNHKKGGEGEADEAPVVLSLQQYVNTEALGYIRTLELEASIMANVVGMLTVCKESNTVINYKAKPVHPEGRISGKGALCTIKKWIRRVICDGRLELIDITNAASTILLQLAAKHAPASSDGEGSPIIVPKLFAKFATEAGREELITEFLVQTGRLDTPANRKSGKKAFNGVINGKRVMDIDEIDCPLMRNWKQACINFVGQFKAISPFDEVWAKVCSLESKKNKNGTFISWVWQREERKIMMCVYKYMQYRPFQEGGVEGKFNVCAWLHDAIGVSRPAGFQGDIFTPERIAAIAARVKEETGFDIVFHSEKCEATEDDWREYCGPRNLSKIPSKDEKCISYLHTKAVREKLVRYDGFVLQHHPRVPGAYVRYLSIPDYVNETLRGQPFYHSNSSSQASMCNTLETKDHRMFPLLQKGRGHCEWISFRNCTFNLDKLELKEWKELDKVPDTEHFYDCELDLAKARQILAGDTEGEKHTPEWTKMLRYQLSQEMYDLMEIMVGRMLFPLNVYDRWQVWLLYYGRSGTGKGVVMKVIRAMKPPGRVGFIAKNTEKIFGLEDLCTKEAVVLEDMPQHISHVIDKSIWQSMVSGEGVPVAKKHKTAVTDFVWRAPAAGASNFKPDFQDYEGEIVRRTVMLKASNVVKNVNPELETILTKEELPYILLRCAAKYRKVATKMHGRDFWKEVAPKELWELRSELESHANPTARFLNSGSMEHVVERKEGHAVRLSEFEKAFLTFMQKDLANKKATVDDINESTLLAKDYKICRTAGERPNVCNYCFMHKTYYRPHENCTESLCGDRRCHHKPSKERCGDHYDEKGTRTRFQAVVGIALLKRDDLDRKEGIEATEAPVVDVEGNSASNILFELLTKKAGCEPDTVRELFKNFQVEAHEGFLYEKHKLTGVGPRGRKTPLSDMLGFEAVTGDKDLRPSKRQKT